ncbi:Creatinase/aminopeptidase [Gigaspora margarita]|uniref:Creatinase/aminopeptidase n=1 Tax=Gigaspora margarita TaxID=4874 RepID=A0A8H4A9P4_GIGMA|nr:Creatinase/aminopeptidase [Gigaspora margarita]
MSNKAHSSVVDTTERLSKLRALFSDYEITAYIIPSEDSHQSEYVAACDARRSFISGFTGSAGLAVVSNDAAALFTDGRYFLQASKQLDTNWKLMKQGLPDVPTWQEYLVQNLQKGSKIGIDPTLITAPDARSLSESLEKVGSCLKPISQNLVDLVWGDKRPARPKNPLIVLEECYSGRSHTEKIENLRGEFKENFYGFIASGLDEIAWLYNLRGSEVEYNPVFFSYSLVTRDEAILYIDDRKLTKEAKDHLGPDVQYRPYDAIFEDLQKHSVKLKNDSQKLLISTRTSWAIARAAGESNIEETRSPITDAKAIKNEVELEGMRQCHLRDSCAVINYFAWLEEQLANGKTINEIDGSNQLEKFRAEQADFMGLSFDTISASGPNGSIIHYKPEPESCAVINPNHLYLCDSGGQYKDGTTDVTRTVHFGTPTEQEKRAFTRVLQGHIAIDRAIFPKGTTGYLLDVLARTSLWRDGLDYRHGTGHGVGCFLNVHEGPQGIGTRIVFNDAPLQAGMTVTNEPGYYEDEKFGIRIETVLLVREVETPNNFGERGYLGFEHITFVPIQTSLVDASLLSPIEHKWLNDFNAECLKKVGPLLKPGSPGHRWLEREAAPLK